MKKNQGIKAVIGELDALKRNQVLAEIRSIKLNYIIAILSILGSVAAFVVLQKNNIIDLFKKEPTISFQVNSILIRTNSNVEVLDSQGKRIITSNLKSFPPNFPLKKGSYKAVIRLSGETIWSASFWVGDNENKTIILPDIFDGRIELTVENINLHPHIEDEIELNIVSNGNGYLWIYEITNKDYKLIFPIGRLEDANAITADKPFEFPAGYALVAGKIAKKEKYCFLVTSINNEEDANGIMHLLFPQGKAKGEVTNVKKSWGARTIEVDVRP
jgi:hypothetical protein